MQIKFDQDSTRLKLRVAVAVGIRMKGTTAYLTRCRDTPSINVRVSARGTIK